MGTRTGEDLSGPSQFFRHLMPGGVRKQSRTAPEGRVTPNIKSSDGPPGLPSPTLGGGGPGGGGKLRGGLGGGGPWGGGKLRGGLAQWHASGLPDSVVAGCCTPRTHSFKTIAKAFRTCSNLSPPPPPMKQE